MNSNMFFCDLTSARIVELIDRAMSTVCFAAPGIQLEPAQAMVKAAQRLGTDMVTVWIDFDERVMRMGFGDIAAVKLLRDAGVRVSHAPALRSGVIIADATGFTFTPTALYLESEPGGEVRNALRLSHEQVAEALVRLSPAAKAFAVQVADIPDTKTPLSELPAEEGSAPVDQTQFEQVDRSLREAPPVRFDIARQVRVFEPYLQYVELNLSGVAIQRNKLTIPPSIQVLGGSKELEGRLRTTFDLIEKNGTLSSKSLEEALNEIRKNFTPSLGKDHGRVVLKAAKPHLSQRLADFRKKLEIHQERVRSELQKHLDESRNQVINYYLPRVIEAPPDALLGRLSTAGKPSEQTARRWLDTQLERVFPKADALSGKMVLDERYKDVTFETLNRDDFLDMLKRIYPAVEWDSAYSEFKAAAQSKQGETATS